MEQQTRLMGQALLPPLEPPVCRFLFLVSTSVLRAAIYLLLLFLPFPIPLIGLASPWRQFLQIVKIFCPLCYALDQHQ